MKEVPKLLQYIKQPNTIKTYLSSFKIFEAWILPHQELLVFPTSSHAVCLYLMNLVQSGKAWSTIRIASVSIAWVHTINGQIDPTKSELVQAVIDSIKRRSTSQIKHKRPVTKEMLVKLHDVLVKQSDNMTITKLRDFVFILISFKVSITLDYLCINVTRSKTDVYAQGNDVFIARTSSKLCLLTWLTRCFVKAGIKDSDKAYIFRATYVNARTNTGLRRADKVLSCTTLAEMFQSRKVEIGMPRKSFSLHCLRAGGVTLAANAGVPESMYKQHGRWRSDAVKYHVSTDVAKNLQVTRCMRL